MTVEDDPDGDAESHDSGCLCGKCFRACLSDNAPWWAPYRLAAFHDPEDAMRLAEHERLVAQGRWLAQRATHDDPPHFGAVLDETLENLANRVQVVD